MASPSGGGSESLLVPARMGKYHLRIAIEELHLVLDVLIQKTKSFVS
jgi:hypothetical protein